MRRELSEAMECGKAVGKCASRIMANINKTNLRDLSKLSALEARRILCARGREDICRSEAFTISIALRKQRTRRENFARTGV
jgi:hypothetical protein